MPVDPSPPTNELTRPRPRNPLTSIWPGNVPRAGPVPNASPVGDPTDISVTLEVGHDHVGPVGEGDRERDRQHPHHNQDDGKFERGSSAL